MVARWKRRADGEYSNEEAAWAAALNEDPNVFEFRFEGVNLRLADRTWYKPDFLVLMMDGSVEYHEVKGSWKAPNQDKSRVKLKVAAEMYPWFTFRAVVAKKAPRKDGGGWSFAAELIGPGKGEDDE